MGVAMLLIVGFAFRQRMNAPPRLSFAALPQSLQPIATTSDALPPAVATAAAAPPYRGAPVAVLRGDPAVIARLPAATHQQSLRDLERFAASLAENPLQPNLWMWVAHVKQLNGDYAGTRDAYEYLNVIAERDGLPFYNLAVIYGYYLKEPSRAEAKYEAALEREPLNTSYYTGFSDFYRQVRGDLERAAATLRRGLEQLPGDTNLFIALAALYREVGDRASAIRYYEAALESGGLGSGGRAAILEELERLRASGQ